jgi:hypothetical protein
MKPQVFASTDQGSMLPLFIGLAAVSLVLCLGVAEFGSTFILKQQIQMSADQVALKSAANNLTSLADVASLVVKQNSKLRLVDFQMLDGKTQELRICGDWQGWLTMPGLDLKTQLCANSASR